MCILVTSFNKLVEKLKSVFATKEEVEEIERKVGEFDNELKKV